LTAAKAADGHDKLGALDLFIQTHGAQEFIWPVHE